jgi:VIT1/CCC1 family predicted Fe2+/Mn2+ transporter
MRVICSARPNTSLAALSSLTLFAAGALVPWFFTEGSAGILLSAALTAIASVFVGAWISWSSGRALWQGAVRQLSIVVLASAVTYGIGSLFAPRSRDRPLWAARRPGVALIAWLDP